MNELLTWGTFCPVGSDSSELSYCVWATAWGPMGALCGPKGLRRIVLPHYHFKDLGELLSFEHPEATKDEGPFSQLIDLTRGYFNARRVSFEKIPCELPDEGSFTGKVHRAARAIPYGRTRSYSALAAMIARPDAARAVATAMSKNPLPLVVPCHRVIYADGRPGGFSAPGGIKQKTRLLTLEAKAPPAS